MFFRVLRFWQRRKREGLSLLDDLSPTQCLIWPKRVCKYLCVNMFCFQVGKKFGVCDFEQQGEASQEVLVMGLYFLSRVHCPVE